jgi:hypothetical protein
MGRRAAARVTQISKRFFDTSGCIAFSLGKSKSARVLSSLPTIAHQPFVVTLHAISLISMTNDWQIQTCLIDIH